MDINPFWKEYQRELRIFIKSRVFNKSMIDDLFHDAYIKAKTKETTLKDKRKVRSWLYQICRNVIIDYYRSNKSPHKLSEVQNEKKRHSRDGDDWKLIAEAVDYKISLLPPIYREAMILSVTKGMTDKDVAQKLGISLSCLKTRIMRGRQRVKYLFETCHIFKFGPGEASIIWDDFEKHVKGEL